MDKEFSMDTITFKLNKDAEGYTRVRVCFNETDTHVCFSPDALDDLKNFPGVDVSEELANLIHYELARFNSSLTESEIKEQVTSEMKRLGLS
jgi:hypothetical protein